MSFIKRLSSSLSFSAPDQQQPPPDQQPPMGACLSATRCPCEAKKRSSIVPSLISSGESSSSSSSSSSCSHFVRISGYALSPYTSAVRIALQFKGIQPDLVQPDDPPLNAQGWWLDGASVNAGQIPTPLLEHGSDSVSGSPDDVLGYIERRFKQPSLVPSWTLKKKVKNWVGYVRDVFAPLLLEAWRDRSLAVEAERELQVRFRAAFEKLNAGIGEYSREGQYFLGKQFSMVDVYLVPFLELLRPLKFLRGVEADGVEHSKLVDYMRKMAGFESYGPVAADAEQLKLMAYRELEERSQIGPAVSFTVLQHTSIVRHMERLVDALTELHQVRRGKSMKKTLSSKKLPSVELVGITTKLKKTAGDYERVLTLLKEHAQMEERFIFPALEKAERGITKVAIEEHARDFPVMNGVREDFKTVMVLEHGSSSQAEALSALATKLRKLKDNTVKHFQDEEKDILPLLEVAGLGVKQQEFLMVAGLSVMESSHSRLLPFFLSTLLPHEIHYYMIMLDRSLRDGEVSRLENVARVLRADEEFQDVWRVAQDRLPLLVATT